MAQLAVAFLFLSLLPSLLHTAASAVTAAPLAVPSSGNVSAFQSCQSVFFCRLAKYLFIYTFLPQKLLLTQTNTVTMGNYYYSYACVCVGEKWGCESALSGSYFADS